MKLKRWTEEGVETLSISGVTLLFSRDASEIDSTETLDSVIQAVCDAFNEKYGGSILLEVKVRGAK